jgi:hypothetical protein
MLQMKKRTSMGRDTGTILLGACGLALAGCTAGARVSVFQPGLAPPQDIIHLQSYWAYASNKGQGVERILLIFPLPGAEAGDKQFFLYLRVPGRRSAPFSIGEPLPDGTRVSGFLIQAKGRFAGKTVFASGQVELHGVPFDPRYRQGRVRVYCDDGSTVEGEFTAKLAPLEVRDFEDAKTGDVQALLNPGTPEAVKQAKERQKPRGTSTTGGGRR